MQNEKIGPRVYQAGSYAAAVAGAKMIWIALEILIPLVLFVVIVWWTLPKRAKPETKKKED
ncbi:MAG: hypothetical protein ACKVP2_16355 [Burkholderiales bacterium]